MLTISYSTCPQERPGRIPSLVIFKALIGTLVLVWFRMKVDCTGVGGNEILQKEDEMLTLIMTIAGYNAEDELA